MNGKNGKRKKTKAVSACLLAIMLAVGLPAIMGKAFPALRYASVSAAMPGLSWSDSAHSGDFTVDMRTDPDCLFTAFSSFYPLQVAVTGQGSDFEGVLKLMIPDGSADGGVLALGQKISLTGDKTSLCSFHIPAGCLTNNGSTVLNHFLVRADILYS